MLNNKIANLEENHGDFDLDTICMCQRQQMHAVIRFSVVKEVWNNMPQDGIMIICV